jgi:DNA-binding transcriptional regulator YiaG
VFFASSVFRIGHDSDKKPSGPSLKLLSLIERKGLEAVI